MRYSRRNWAIVASLAIAAATTAPAFAAKATKKPVKTTTKPTVAKSVATQPVTTQPVTTQAATPATAATTQPAKADAKVPGITDSTIKIGLTGPYTGVAAAAGQGIRTGVQIAVDEVNAAGGIGGRKLELVGLDDGFGIPQLVANMRRLIDDDKVYAIVAAAGSQALPGAWDFVKEKGTIVWAPITPPDPKLPSVFIVGPSRTEQTRIAIDFMCEKGVKRIALIGQTNSLGAEGKAGAAIQLPKCTTLESASLVAEEYLEPTKTDGVSAAVQKVVAAKADGLMLVTDNVQAALTLKRLKELGQTPGGSIIVIAENGAGGPGGVNTVGQAGDAADGFYSVMQQDLPTSEITRGVILWRALARKSGYPQAESNFSLQTYGYTKMFIEILKKEAAAGDFSYANFQKIAEATSVDLDFLPKVACGPLPDGHACARGAGVAQYRGAWGQVRDFKTPK